MGVSSSCQEPASRCPLHVNKMGCARPGSDLASPRQRLAVTRDETELLGSSALPAARRGATGWRTRPATPTGEQPCASGSVRTRACHGACAVKGVAPARGREEESHAQVRPPIPLHHAVIAERARCFRRHMQSEEAALWRLLRGRRLGARFVRQHVVGSFILDFAAPAVRLAVEVDGGTMRFAPRRMLAATPSSRAGGGGCCGWRRGCVVAQPATAVALVRAAFGQGSL